MALVWDSGDIKWDPWLAQFRLPPFMFSEGVYVIWKESSRGDKTALYVGSGDISARVKRHLADWLGFYVRLGGHVRVAWVWSWLDEEKEGVERYLADVYQPRFGLRHPTAEPIPVNLPWETEETRRNAWLVELFRPGLSRTYPSWLGETLLELPSPPLAPRYW